MHEGTKDCSSWSLEPLVVANPLSMSARLKMRKQNLRKGRFGGGNPLRDYHGC